MDETDRWFFRSNINGTIDLIIPDSEDYVDAMSAAMDLYSTWVIVDQGSYGEVGDYVTLAIEEQEL